MNRTRILTLAAAVLTAAAFAAPAAPASAHTICDRSGSRTVAQNSTVRVFTARPPHYDADNGDGPSLYGCLFSNGNTVRLEDSYDDQYVESYGFSRVRLAGRFVAWQFTHTDVSCKAACPPGYEATTYKINVYDVRAREGTIVSGAHSAGKTLQVNSRGAAAWLENLGGGQREVRVLDSDGTRVLDTGAIHGGSAFKLSGATLRWVNGETPHSATLR